MITIDVLQKLPTIDVDDRYVLRPMKLDDYNAYYETMSAVEVAEFLGRKPFASLHEAKQHLERVYFKGNSQNFVIGLAIEDTVDDKFIGSIGIWDLDLLNRKGRLSFALNKDYWNQGIGSECCLKFVDYCFRHYEFETITSVSTSDNVRFVKLMDHIGFKEVDRVFDDHHNKDMIQYSLNVEDLELKD